MFKIANLKEFNNKLNARLEDGARKNVGRAVFKSINIVKNEAINSIVSGAKSGITYEKYNPRRTHTASRAGEPPASDTGFLASQISADMNIQGRQIVGEIISAAPYSKSLEFGTTNMMARPFMQPAFKKNKRKILGIFKREGVIG